MNVDHVQHISLMQSVQSAQSSTRTFPTLLPRIAPAPTNPTFGDHSAVMQKKPKEPIRKKSVEKIVAAEDKRKRNTAASARFRMKKKMKEHDLEKQTTEMIQKTEELEAHVRELEKEIKWLRELVVEKNSSLLKGSKPETINE
ncbi:hypothetical protein CLU79DRAFT_505429 [Phycomyces nitens]|nr:hypothetical protein CLU79DRAFT_505429 [Phycomyces nitens]